MNKQELADCIATEIDCSTRLALRCIQLIEQAITQELARGGEVRVAGFGTFSTTTRTARSGRNPRTGEPIAIPARRAVRFVPAKALKGAVSAWSTRAAQAPWIAAVA